MEWAYRLLDNWPKAREYRYHWRGNSKEGVEALVAVHQKVRRAVDGGLAGMTEFLGQHPRHRPYLSGRLSYEGFIDLCDEVADDQAEFRRLYKAACESLGEQPHMPMMEKLEKLLEAHEGHSEG